MKVLDVLQPDGDYYSCGAFGDDKDKPIDFEREMQGEFFTPLQDSFRINNNEKKVVMVVLCLVYVMVVERQ